jgi:hypothetical protein
MTRKPHWPILVVLLGLMLPLCLAAQSDDPAMPLGDLARALRKGRGLPAHTVIDNDNLSQVMDEVESHRLSRGLLFSLDGLGKSFQVSSPDVTCNLSFNAQAISVASDPVVARDLPESELVKLEGPATLAGDRLQVSVFNGTGWDLREITVGLTIVRGPDPSAAYFGPVKLVPAVAASVVLSKKNPDVTVLYHLKGTAAPFTTTVFQETLGTTPGPDQDWHWAIVEAKGIPPK